jgi:p-aminobenzoyl-glutamate transporter AbgT
VDGRDADDVSTDAAWDEARRGESRTQRLDRNWLELLQELRVVQTGVQVLTGFLVTLPFQQRFGELDQHSLDVYLASISAAVVATAALVAPVSIHRVLFRQHAREPMVAVGHRFAIVGLAMLAIAVCGVSDLILSLLVSDTAGAIAAGIAAALFIALWLVLPLWLRHVGPRHDPSRDEQ